MARLFADLADYRAYTGDDDGATLTEQQLRSASLLIMRATRHASYKVHGDGTAVDPAVEGALRDATCEVLRRRAELGVSSDVTLADLGLRSASIGSASYSLVEGGAPGAWRTLPFDAHLILEAAGLIGGPVRVVG